MVVNLISVLFILAIVYVVFQSRIASLLVPVVVVLLSNIFTQLFQEVLVPPLSFYLKYK